MIRQMQHGFLYFFLCPAANLPPWIMKLSLQHPDIQKDFIQLTPRGLPKRRRSRELIFNDYFRRLYVAWRGFWMVEWDLVRYAVLGVMSVWGGG